MKPFQKDPFSLMSFHRVLIGTTILGALFYGGWEISRNLAAEGAAAAGRATIAFAVAIGAGFYLWRLRGKK